jgi:hypothetical protein
MRRASAHGVDKRHWEHFVGWFEGKVSNVVIYMSKRIAIVLFVYLN